MAVGGAHFSGSVDAGTKGTIINYSEGAMTIEGNTVISFDRQSSTKVPAGFDSHRVLTYNPSSYEEFAM